MQMSLNLFEFKTYKAYLRALMHLPENRGLLSRLAEAAGCQRPYLSKVLQQDSEVHLTPDHMFGICEYLALPELEEDYLKLLLERDRASSSKYRQSIEKKIESLQNQHLNLQKQLGKEQVTSSSDPMGFYYSYYLYAALHIAVSIPSLQTLPKLARKFSLPEQIIENHLVTLQQAGLVKKEKGHWQWKSGDLHLSQESLWILPHHMNWRQQAVQDVAMRESTSTHYSLVQSVSRDDYEALRLKVVGWIKQFQKVSGPSTPEELVCFNLDLFKVGQS